MMYLPTSVIEGYQDEYRQAIRQWEVRRAREDLSVLHQMFGSKAPTAILVRDEWVKQVAADIVDTDAGIAGV